MFSVGSRNELELKVEVVTQERHWTARNQINHVAGHSDGTLGQRVAGWRQRLPLSEESRASSAQRKLNGQRSTSTYLFGFDHQSSLLYCTTITPISNRRHGTRQAIRVRPVQRTGQEYVDDAHWKAD
jgi:hypothetical protein